uniref:Uncharacterized protein n=1 Tax=Microcystis aeruginosa (strain PCC 7806) TaxID=267872 RepID=A8YNU5_MICA7|nr:unnamed protein product [Microcystis aeruginosa PCC 7806]
MLSISEWLAKSSKYLGKINYILASKIVQHFFKVSEEALSVFIGAKFNPIHIFKNLHNISINLNEVNKWATKIFSSFSFPIPQFSR